MSLKSCKNMGSAGNRNAQLCMWVCVWGTSLLSTVASCHVQTRPVMAGRQPRLQDLAQLSKPALVRSASDWQQLCKGMQQTQEPGPVAAATGAGMAHVAGTVMALGSLGCPALFMACGEGSWKSRLLQYAEPWMTVGLPLRSLPSSAGLQLLPPVRSKCSPGPMPVLHGNRHSRSFPWARMADLLHMRPNSCGADCIGFL